MINEDIGENELIEQLFGKDRKKMKELSEFERRRVISDTAKVMSTPEGLRFLWWLLEQAHLFNSSFTGQSNTTIFREGERNVGLKVLNNVLEVDKNFFAEMINSKLTSTKER